MTKTIQVQLYGVDVNLDDVEKLVKEDLKNNGIRLNTIDTLNIYYKPEARAVYYVATTKDKKVYGVGNTPLHI